MEKHGITTLKMFVLWGISLAEQLEETFEDKKFRWHEAFGFVDEGKALAELLPLLDEAGDEFRDLSTEEKNELIAFVAEKLSLSSDWATRITTSALDLASSGYIAIKTQRDFKAFKNRPQA